MIKVLIHIVVLQFLLERVASSKSRTKLSRTLLVLLCTTAVFGYELYTFYQEKQPNLYEVLNTRRDASLSDLNKNFRYLSRQLHPDKNRNRDTTNQFIQIREAYEILKNTTKAATYDRFGSTDESLAMAVNENMAMLPAIMKTLPFYTIFSIISLFFSNKKVWLISDKLKDLTQLRMFLSACIVCCTYEILVVGSGVDEVKFLEVFWPKKMAIFERVEILRILVPLLLNLFRAMDLIFRPTTMENEVVSVFRYSYSLIEVSLMRKQKQAALLAEILRRNITTKDEYLALRNENPTFFAHLKLLPQPESSQNVSEEVPNTENRGNAQANPAVEAPKGRGWISKAAIVVIIGLVIKKAFWPK